MVTVNSTFTTGGMGATIASRSTQTFTLPPSLPAGPLMAMQGIVFQPVGTTPFGFLLTAAFLLIG